MLTVAMSQLATLRVGWPPDPPPLPLCVPVLTEFERLASLPPPARTYWAVVGPEGQQLRLYRTAAAAKAQLKRWPAGSTVQPA